MPDTPPPPLLLIELVERFTLNRDRYLSPDYNEEQLRHEFLNPMFELLGWDMTNKQGFSDAYKDVLYEESLKPGAPDYSFRIGGTRKFFLEAKAPHVDAASHSPSAAQLRSYAWSAKLPLSILTDFANLAVYDGRIPVRSELPAPGEARVLLIPYTEYPARWAEIEAIFSKQAVLKGLFDRFAESKTDKRGTAPVDEEFLDQISHWRERLASHLRESNPDLTAPDLNFAVQMTIDRIVFLRIAEDRGLEPYGQLQTIAKVPNIHGELQHLFASADTRYNSGLFHFRAEPNRSSLPDRLTPELHIGDPALHDIITGLYPPKSHYRFSHVPSEILGQVYEQFLGKVIVLTPKRAKVEEKPEVRKAGGVYYTPSYIVDYIINQTVGELLKDKTPDQAAELKILDPACGSGSFLLGAYQKLLDWHLDYYHHHDPAKLARQKTPPIREIPAAPSSGLFTSQPSYRLTINERKRILTYNIFGVDIDPQAVEVTKLSLLLKCLEGETSETIHPLLKFMRQRALPDLDDNIKCGNSLIAPDFYEPAKFPENQNLTEDEKRRINAMDWNQAFPKIMTPGGFHVVLGNPPYIDSEWMTTWLPRERAYLTSACDAASGNWDMFCVFVDKTLQLCRTNGLASLIVPNKLGSARYAAGARAALAAQQLCSIRDYSRVPVFPVAVYPIVYIAAKTPPTEQSTVLYERMAVDPGEKLTITETRTLARQRYFADPQQPWAIFGPVGTNGIAYRIAQGFPALATLATVLGAATVAQAYEIQNLIRNKTSADKDDLAVVNSGTIDRFSTNWGHVKLRYLGKSYLQPVVPKGLQKNLPPTRLAQARRPKLIVAGMTKSLECAPDLNGRLFAAKSTSIIFSDVSLVYLLGLLNSRLINYYFTATYGGNALQGGYLRVGPPQLKTIPIRPINFADPADQSRHDRMVQLVTRMLDLHKKLAAAKLPTDQTRLQREIAATDQQIDALVYDLYHLTPAEILLIESAASTP